MTAKIRILTLGISVFCLLAVSASAQPVALRPEQLDQLVSRIALYPDPLLAQVLTASTFPDQIPEAARWADDHSDLHGDPLAKAIQDDRLPWDPSVLALLPFPSVLDMMSRDVAWTRQLGDAVLAQRPEVMDAVQRMRRKADDYGYLIGNPSVSIARYPGYIEILPSDPAYIYVPVYDPLVVFAPPSGRVAVAAAIAWGPPVFIGTVFAPFGWVHAGFAWPSHVVLIAGKPWGRAWTTRGTYAHPYAWVRPVEPRVERHQIPRATEARRRR